MQHTHSIIESLKYIASCTYIESLLDNTNSYCIYDCIGQLAIVKVYNKSFGHLPITHSKSVSLLDPPKVIQIELNNMK